MERSSVVAAPHGHGPFYCRSQGKLEGLLPTPQAGTQQAFQDVISDLRSKGKREVTVLLLGASILASFLRLRAASAFAQIYLSQ